MTDNQRNTEPDKALSEQQLPSLRNAGKVSHVLVELADTSDGATAVSLSVFGFEEGADWDAGKEYFEAAWGRVLTGLRQYFERDS